MKIWFKKIIIITFIPKSDDFGDFFKLGVVVLVVDNTSSDSSTVSIFVVSSSAWSLFSATHLSFEINTDYNKH